MIENLRNRALIDSLLSDRESYTGSVSQDLKRLWRDYLGHHKVKVFTTIAVTIVWSVHPYGMSLLARFLVDQVLRVEHGFDPADIARQIGLLRTYIIALFGLWAVFIVMTWTHSYLALNIGQDLVFDLRRDLHAKLQRLHVGFFERIETGKLMSRVLDDVGVIQQWCTTQLINISAFVMRILLGTIILLLLNWRLGLLAVVAMPLYAVVFLVIYPRLVRTNIAIRRLNANMYGLSDERISGIKVVQAFAQERHERRRFQALMDNMVRLSVQSITFGQTQNLVTAVITAIFSGTIIMLGMRQVQTGEMSLGDVMVFIYALPNLFTNVQGLSTVSTQVQSVLVVVRRVFQLLDTEESVKSGTTSLQGRSPSISFEKVSFAYPGQTGGALTDLSFSIPAGARVAIVGPSGAGKTTIFQLLMRFYDPGQGHVQVAGVDLREADMDSAHRFIRMVQQEPEVFSGSLVDNVVYGREDATPTQIMRAAQQAELHEFIMTMPAKYETQVGQNGISLSGGQRQRLALTTALLTEPSVLLLDDTTSALDAETEARIRTTLDKVLAGRTSLIITQRVATARGCDLILVLEGGVLTGQGTHRELVEASGFYARIVAQQESL